MLQKVSTACALLIYLIVFHLSQTTDAIKLTNLNCIAVDKTWLEFRQCDMKAVNRETVELNIFVKLFQPINDNLTLTLRVIRRNTKLPPVVEYTVDPCKFLVNKRRNPLAEMFYQFLGFSKYSNMNHSCPYDHDLLLKNARVDKSIMNYLPIGSGDYVIETDWLAFNVPRCHIKFSFFKN